MARRATLNVESLTALGAAKLAQLIIEEAERNAPFKRLVAAAQAAQKGPDAVAAIIDRRIAALEKARGFIEWDRAKTFAGDLETTVKTIVQELGAASPKLAVERLLRFIAAYNKVLERVDDSSGRISAVFDTAISGLGPLAAAMGEADRAQLPQLIEARGAAEKDYRFVPMAAEVAPHVPPDALRAWDRSLEEKHTALKSKGASPGDWERNGQIDRLAQVRQLVADALGDLDAIIALEESKPEQHRRPGEIAQKLAEAGRFEEALRWVRMKSNRRFVYDELEVSASDGSFKIGEGARARLESHILDRLGQKAEAQAVRWKYFEEMLDAEMLREHVRHLDDFAEFEVLDKAFAHASRAKDIYRALAFFLAWPKLDAAARLVASHARAWEGRLYHHLVPAAAALEADHPTAATILYRALLDDILARARSQAYGHAARYLAKLNALADAFDPKEAPNVDLPATYFTDVQKAHGRKQGFWMLVDRK